MTEVWEPHAPRTAAEAREVALEGLVLRVVGEVTSARSGAGVHEMEIRGDGDVRVEWRLPCVGATAFWTPETGPNWLPAAWAGPARVSLTRGAPVASLVGAGDIALCTFAAAQTAVLAGAGVLEETGEFRCWIQAPGELRLRIDLSGRHFAHTLADVATWWEPAPREVPRAARLPAYSTWYSMHQNISPQAVEEQARLGKALGLDLVIVDDGWMTLDRGRGYGHCGDWAAVSLPDTAEHVRRVQAMGVRYLLWYAIPFVGRDSSVWERLRPYALREAGELNAIIVDPRYPLVRDHLVATHARAVTEWGMDGLKIDFVDWFAGDAPEAGPEADCRTVDEGVRRLLAELNARIPDALIEHRQPYTSPGLWPHATMIRATDCPLSPAENRQRVLDLRLVAGPLAVHADMIMWHPDETPERVAVHLISVLFGVPQISVDLAAQTDAQREVLEFWLGIFHRRLDVLQRGVLEPSRPELGYPLAKAYDGRTMVVARYAPLPVEVPSTGWDELLLANADHCAEVLLTGGPRAEVPAEIRDARGRLTWTGALGLGGGPVAVEVPTGGLLTLGTPAR